MKGFTLIEMILVVAIAVIGVMIALPMIKSMKPIGGSHYSLECPVENQICVDENGEQVMKSLCMESR